MKARNLIVGLLATLALPLLAQAGNGTDGPKRPEATADAMCPDVCHSDTCCGDACCDDSCWEPRWQVFGEFLYLRPRNAGVEYAVPFHGPISTSVIPLQEGRTAALNPEFEPGFRVGFGRMLDPCTTISASYTHYENDTDDSITTTAPLVIRSLVMHPSSFDAAIDWLDASAHQAIDFDIVDLDYRHEFLGNECSSLSYLLGIRYANLKQRFRSAFSTSITDNVNTDVNFDGAGFRLGLEGERRGLCCNAFVYAKAAASFLGGEFRGDYLQESTAGGEIVNTNWKEARLVSILECEVGLGWMSPSGRVRVSAGYAVNGWLNVVKTSEFISSVQANKYHGPDKIDGNGLVFDGLVAHLELRW
jgi:hypothetical protein